MRRTFAIAAAVAALCIGGSFTITQAQTAPSSARATLAARPGQRLSGTATLAAQGARTIVTVSVTGGPPTSTHVNHIHIGTCENEGAIVYPLADLRTDASGAATASTTVDAPLASLVTGANYVNVHAGPSLPSPGTSCGNIVAGATGLPATGGDFNPLWLAGAAAILLAAGARRR
jgi:hypothetical protein